MQEKKLLMKDENTVYIFSRECDVLNRTLALPKNSIISFGTVIKTKINNQHSKMLFLMVFVPV